MILPYVYILTDKITGQFYIGYRYKNVTLHKRSNEDLGVVYFTSCKHISKNNFYRFDAVILAEFFDKADAYWFEQQLIKDNRKNPLMLNKHYQDPNTENKEFVNFGHSEETIQKMTGLRRSDAFRDYRRLAMSGSIPWNKGLSKDTDPRMAELARKRKEHGNPHLIGRTYSKTHVEKIRNALTGRSMTDEERVKMSAAKRGKTWEEIFGNDGAKARRDMQRARSGENSPRSKKVHTDLGEFVSVTAARKALNIAESTVRNRCLSTNIKWIEWYYIEDVTL
jgi:hypothetical protein